MTPRWLKYWEAWAFMQVDLCIYPLGSDVTAAADLFGLE